MKKYIIVCIIIMGCIVIFSCTDSDSPSGVSYQLPLEVIWSQVYGNEAYDEYAVSAVVTDWNQIVVAANSFSTGFYDVSGWLFFTQHEGILYRENYYRLGGDTNFEALKKTQDSGYIILGAIDSGTTSIKSSLLKTNSMGDKIWDATFFEGTSQYPGDVHQLSDGGYIFSSIITYSIGDRRIGLTRTDDAGEIIWISAFCQESNFNHESDMEIAHDGDYVVVGSIFVPNSESNILLIKVSTNGDSLWSHQYSPMYRNTVRAMKRTSDNGFIICGSSNNGGSDFRGFVIKVDSEGNEEWSWLSSGEKSEDATDVIETEDGGFLILLNPHSWSDVRILKTDMAGNEQWDEVIVLPINENCHCLVETAPGEFIIAGNSRNVGETNVDALLVKLECE